MLKQHKFARANFAIAVSLAFASPVTAADSQNYLCENSKAPLASWAGSSIACYTDKACALVTTKGGEPLRDYDAKSVSAALGRGKIEAVLTTSTTIVANGRKFGYSCKKIALS